MELLPVNQMKVESIQRGDDFYLDFNLTWHKSLAAIVDRIIEWSQLLYRADVPRCMVLAGHSGSGKTHLAEMLHKHGNYNSQMVNEVKLFETLRDCYSRKASTSEIYNRCQKARILIYDDLGRGKGNSEWTDEIYYTLFNTDQAYLITTNLTKQQFAARLGPPVTSRLQGAMGGDLDTYFIEMWKVPDYRASARPEMRR